MPGACVASIYKKPVQQPFRLRNVDLTDAVGSRGWLRSGSLYLFRISRGIGPRAKKFPCRLESGFRATSTASGQSWPGSFDPPSGNPLHRESVQKETIISSGFVMASVAFEG